MCPQQDSQSMEGVICSMSSYVPENTSFVVLNFLPVVPLVIITKVIFVKFNISAIDRCTRYWWRFLDKQIMTVHGLTLNFKAESLLGISHSELRRSNKRRWLSELKVWEVRKNGPNSDLSHSNKIDPTSVNPCAVLIIINYHHRIWWGNIDRPFR